MTSVNFRLKIFDSKLNFLKIWWTNPILNERQYSSKTFGRKDNSVFRFFFQLTFSRKLSIFLSQIFDYFSNFSFKIISTWCNGAFTTSKNLQDDLEFIFSLCITRAMIFIDIDFATWKSSWMIISKSNEIDCIAKLLVLIEKKIISTYFYSRFVCVFLMTTVWRICVGLIQAINNVGSEFSWNLIWQ